VPTVPATRVFRAIVFSDESAACSALAAVVSFSVGVGVGDSGEASAALIREYKTTVAASAQTPLDRAEGRMQFTAPI
jgi:hypothetical protein